ncbi:MAG TPA: hypothetical protein VG937_31590 [Polyangiaceae bacterium]|nr:hypothetical protein [Polyangiaceae bacterium]
MSGGSSHPATALRVFALLALLVALCCGARNAHAETLQAPVGGKPIALGKGTIACPPIAGGWLIDSKGTTLKPPTSSDAIGDEVEVKVASAPAGCAAASKTLKLIATDKFPTLDPTSATLYADEARFELRGRGLGGVGIAWKAGGASGSDVCRDPKQDGGLRQCRWAVGRNLPADPSAVALSWFPAGGRPGADVLTFDAEGRAQPASAFVLPVARVLLTRLVPADAAIDLSTGQGEIPLSHPEVTSAVDCTGANCSLFAGKIMVRGQSSLVSSVDVRLRLLPHVFYKKGENTDAQPTLRLAVLHCPMAVASGPPVRGLDSARVVVKFGGRCAKELSALHFFSGSTPLEVEQSVTEGDEAWVVLHLGTVDASSVSVTAVRGDLEGIPVAVARTPLRVPPKVRTSLEIPGYPRLDFIPTNRTANVHVAPIDKDARLVVLPVDGIYDANIDGERMTVQGDPYAEGLTALRFGYRLDTLPPPLNQVDLAVLSDPLQRALREANIPAPIDLQAQSRSPLVEVICADGKGGTLPLQAGETAHLPYRVRDSCRLIVHRERLSPEFGTQRLSLEIDVLRSDGSVRSEAHVTQQLVLRSGAEPRLAWIHGVSAPFDRISVRLSHVADEAHYVGATELLSGEPALKWTAVLGTGHARLYGTTTIPTGLYRFGDANHSGVLSLNFGVISRLTWLDAEGHEGFLGLEGGLMVIGLTGDESTAGKSLTQVGAVFGIGMSIPIANRSSAAEASINLHGWFERDIEAAGTDSTGKRWSIIFGPSISIGNIGANL